MSCTSSRWNKCCSGCLVVSPPYLITFIAESSITQPHRQQTRRSEIGMNKHRHVQRSEHNNNCPLVEDSSLSDCGRLHLFLAHYYKHVIKCVKGELISQLHYRLCLKTIRHAQYQLVRHMQYQNVIIKQVAAQNGKLQCHGSDVIVVIWSLAILEWLGKGTCCHQTWPLGLLSWWSM